MGFTGTPTGNQAGDALSFTWMSQEARANLSCAGARSHWILMATSSSQKSQLAPRSKTGNRSIHPRPPKFRPSDASVPMRPVLLLCSVASDECFPDTCSYLPAYQPSKQPTNPPTKPEASKPSKPASQPSQPSKPVTAINKKCDTLGPE